MNSENGFTLIEILIAVTIIALVTLVAMPQFVTVSQEKTLTSAVESVYNQMIIARNNSATGVNGSWYGIYVEKNKQIEQFEVTKPEQCSILKFPIKATPDCTSVTQTKFISLPNSTRISSIKLHYFNPDTNLEQEFTSDKVEIRFGRGQSAYNIAINTPDAFSGPVNSPEIYRAEITFTSSADPSEQKIVIDGGNICEKNIPSGTNNCNMSSGIPGGLASGRIFIVQPSI